MVSVAAYYLNEAKKSEVTAKFQNLDLCKPQKPGAAEPSGEHRCWNQAELHVNHASIIHPLLDTRQVSSLLYILAEIGDNSCTYLKRLCENFKRHYLWSY